MKKPEMQCKECNTAAISKYECSKCGYHCCRWHYDYHEGRCPECEPPRLSKIKKRANNKRISDHHDTYAGGVMSIDDW